MALLELLYLFYSVIVITVVFLLMEGVAWFLHRYIMHGVGWFLHEDHHRATGTRFQKNDLFGLLFGVTSFILILTGALARFDIRASIGIGIMFYGIGYFLVHDIFFHRRIRIRYRPKSAYMERVLDAHAIHHQKSTAHAGVNFGFLYASKKSLAS